MEERGCPQYLLPILLLQVGSPLILLDQAAAADQQQPVGEPEEMAVVQVADLPLIPAGDLRESEQRFELHPHALIGGGYDSNPDVPPAGDGRSDVFGRAQVGLLGRYHPHPGLEGSIDGQAERIDYEHHPVLDSDSDHLVGTLLYDAPELSWHSDARWQRSQDTLISTGQEVSQDFYQAHSKIGHDSSYLWEDLNLTASYLNYRQATTSFDAIQGDHATYDAAMRTGTISSGNRYYVLALVEAVRYRLPGRFNDCDAAILALGGRFAPALRTNGHVEVGVESRRYSADYLQDPANRDRLITVPWVDAQAVWCWHAQDRLESRVYSRADDSITSNATWSMGAEAGSHVDVTRRLRMESLLGIEEQRDGGWTQRTFAVQRQVRQATVSCEYALAAGLATRIHATYLQVSASNDPSYHRYVLATDVAYAY
jgi:hypothetical protein